MMRTSAIGGRRAVWALSIALALVVTELSWVAPLSVRVIAASAAAAPSQQDEGCPRRIPEQGGGAGSETIAVPQEFAGLDAPIMRSWRGHDGSPLDARFDASGQRMATMGMEESGTVLRVWEVATNKLLASWPINLMSYAISPDGDHVAFARNTEDRHTIVVASVDGSQPEIEFPLTLDDDVISEVAFSASGNLLAEGTWHGRVLLWDISKQRLLRNFVGVENPEESMVAFGHSGGVRSITFNADNSLMLTSGGYPDKTVRLWDVATGKHLKCFEVDSDAFGLDKVRLLDGGREVAACDQNLGKVFWWDMETAELLNTVTLAWPRSFEPTDYWSSEYFCSEDMRTALRWGGFEARRPHVDVMDVGSGRLKATLYFPKAVIFARFLPDTRTVLTGTASDPGARSDDLYLWDSNHPLARQLARHAEQIEASLDALLAGDTGAAQFRFQRANTLLPVGLPDVTRFRFMTDFGYVLHAPALRPTFGKGREALVESASQIARSYSFDEFRPTCLEDPAATRACGLEGIEVPTAGWLGNRSASVRTIGEVVARASPGNQGAPLFQLRDGAFLAVYADDDTGKWLYVQSIFDEQLPGWVLRHAVVVNGYDGSRSATVLGDNKLNVRGSPATGSLWLYQLLPGEQAEASARNREGTWLYIHGPLGEGWVSAAYMAVDGDIGDLPVKE